jgi:hypothetical protein
MFLQVNLHDHSLQHYYYKLTYTTIDRSMPLFNRKNHIIKEGGGTTHELDGSRPVGEADSRGGGCDHDRRERPAWRSVQVAVVEGD